MKSLLVAGLTSGQDVPSARFRVRQYQAALQEHGVSLKEYAPFVRQQVRLPGFLNRIRRRYLLPWAALQTLLNIAGRVPAFLGARRSDLVLINRTVIPGIEEAVDLLPRPRILDVDDAIWITNPRGEQSMARLARHVDAVIAGNEYIANWFQRHNHRVYVVPTAVDTQTYCPISAKGDSALKKLTIGWMGTSGNFRHLELARPAVESVIKRSPQVRALIVSNRRPANWRFDGDKYVFRYWSESSEIQDFREMDIGLMPLHDEEWARGKCSFKMLQYLAVGIPVIASPVGMNADVFKRGNIGLAPCTEAEWEEALSQLFDNDDERSIMGAAGRRIVKQYYSTDCIAKQLAGIIREVHARGLE